MIDESQVKAVAKLLFDGYCEACSGDSEEMAMNAAMALEILLPDHKESSDSFEVQWERQCRPSDVSG